MREKARKVHDVFERIAATYDGTNGRISLGMEGQWKHALTRAVARHVPPAGQVLDVCCGTGDIALAIQRQRPDVHITGLDFSAAMLREAQRKDTRRTIHWQQGDAQHLPFHTQLFSAVTISFGLRNTTDYERVIAEMYRVTKPGGWFYCLDSYVPPGALIRPGYELYFRYIMPLLGGGMRQVQAYRWLWQSTQQFLRSHEVTTLLQQVGWQQVQETRFLFGACVLHCAQKRWT